MITEETFPDDCDRRWRLLLHSLTERVKFESRSNLKKLLDDQEKESTLYTYDSEEQLRSMYELEVFKYLAASSIQDKISIGHF